MSRDHGHRGSLTSLRRSSLVSSVFEATGPSKIFPLEPDIDFDAPPRRSPERKIGAGSCGGVGGGGGGIGGSGFGGGIGGTRSARHDRDPRHASRSAGGGIAGLGIGSIGVGGCGGSVDGGIGGSGGIRHSDGRTRVHQKR